MVAGRGVSLAEARVGQCGEGLGMPVGSGVGVLLWEASPSPLQQGPSSSDAALPTRVGVVGDAREAALPSLRTTGKYILIWKYVEKTAHIPKFLEKRGCLYKKRGQGARLIHGASGSWSVSAHCAPGS